MMTCESQARAGLLKGSETLVSKNAAGAGAKSIADRPKGVGFIVSGRGPNGHE